MALKALHAMDRFEAFSALHLLTVLGFALLWSLIIRIGLAWRDRGAWRIAVGAVVLLAWVFANAVQLLPGRYVASENLPLQACDIAGMLAGPALWWPRRRVSALMYFWGLGFCLQAIATPELVGGPAHVDYWTFWVPHANLMGVACYLLVVERYRPGWRAARFAFAAALLYLALILPFDLLSGFNYGYVGPAKPAQATLLDWLGPWPWRIGSMAGLTAFVFALMTWPWVALERRRGAGAAQGRGY